MGSEAVICRGVTKEFVQGNLTIRALRGVDLMIRFGELTLLVGPSGCGKTTLLSLIAGVLDATSGDVQVLGEDLCRISPQRKTAFRMANVGIVFQLHNLLPALTAAENAAVPLLIARQPWQLALSTACELLGQMGLDQRLRSLPANLSGGEQQRVAIARALVHQPRLLLCDEPTSALDAGSGQAIMQHLRDIAVQPDRAVIVVTHDPRVFEFADRIGTMEDGRIVDVQEGPP